MESFLPLFPLKLVAFPGEHLSLHIFEPRYKQLVNDVLETDSTFGIAVYLDKLMSFGSEVKLMEVSKVYEDGRMDIKTIGGRVFEILSFDNPAIGKLYAGGRVVYKDDNIKVSESLYAEFLFYLKELFRLMDYAVELIPLQVNSFTFAHKIGLKLEEEYDLLMMDKESDRIKYIIRHLLKVIPILRDIESAKEKIKNNGHFKSLDPLNF
jgi:uncharacterized protein